MGEAVVEQAKRAHGEARVQGVLFSPAAKLDMATRLKDLMEDRRLRLPVGDRALRADLHSVERHIGQTGIPRLIADREGGSHADRFWALALAVSAAAEGAIPIDYASAGPLASMDAGDYGLGQPRRAPADTGHAGWGTVPGGLDLGGYR